jgi:hypothetical protein
MHHLNAPACGCSVSARHGPAAPAIGLDIFCAPLVRPSQRAMATGPPPQHLTWANFGSLRRHPMAAAASGSSHTLAHSLRGPVPPLRMGADFEADRPLLSPIDLPPSLFRPMASATILYYSFISLTYKQARPRLPAAQHPAASAKLPPPPVLSPRIVSVKIFSTAYIHHCFGFPCRYYPLRIWLLAAAVAPRPRRRAAWTTTILYTLPATPLAAGSRCQSCPRRFPAPISQACAQPRTSP